MIRSIFFTRFHPEKGSRVLHQVPEGSIIPSSSPSALKQTLFDFPSISEYIIPRQEFCDRLITVCVSHYRVIGYPVCINDYRGKYDRNQFIFNLAFVLEDDVADWSSYASVVRKLGRLLRGLEEQGTFLSEEEDPSWFTSEEADQGTTFSGKLSRMPSPTALGEGADTVRSDVLSAGMAGRAPGTGGKVYSLCEMILEDLNNYCECMIPIDDTNTINLKLFPTHAPPAPVHSWHVPLLTIDLSSFSSGTISSDLTLRRILPFIDGVNSVSHISQHADTDLALTRKAVQHLVYYGVCILLDIFQFGAVYAPTAEIGGFIVDEAVQDECARYVRLPLVPAPVHHPPDSRSSVQSEDDIITSSSESTASQSKDDSDKESPDDEDDNDSVNNVSKETLIKLYTSLRQGLTLRNWVLENLDLLRCIDVRRLITFGVIKGFLYRAHKYAIANPSMPFNGYDLGENGATRDPRLHEWPIEAGYGFSGELGMDLPLARYLDGKHCFDEICTELRMPEREVLDKMKGFGDVQIIHR